MNLIIKYLEDVIYLRKKYYRSNKEELANLFWYGKSIIYFISMRGILETIILFYTKLFFKNTHNDEIAKNYGINTIYFKDIKCNDWNESTPTVWNYKKRKSQPFYKDLEVIKILEDNSKDIIKEYEHIQNLMDTHPDNGSLMALGVWEGLYLYFTDGSLNEPLAVNCPTTAAILNTLDLCKNYGFVMFSKITPNSHIMSHCGSSNMRLRVHLGIKVPEPEKTRLRVGTKWYHWEEGKAFAFDDSFSHEVVHEGELDRVILSIDIWHPQLTDKEKVILSDKTLSFFGRIKSQELIKTIER